MLATSGRSSPASDTEFPPLFDQGFHVATVTKKEIMDRIADAYDINRGLARKIIQQFLDDIVDELGKGNRLEFRDFGVFEAITRESRIAQNPKTLKKFDVPSKKTVKFKAGRLMRESVLRHSQTIDHATGLPRRTAAEGGSEAESG